MKSPNGLNADLPVADITKEAIELLWQKRSQVLRMFLPAMLILALVDWSSTNLFAEDAQSAQLLFMLVSVILGILFATACHRFTLLPPEGWNRNALHAFRREEFRYLLRAIQIGVAAALIFFLIMIGSMLLLGKELAVLAAVAGALPALYVWARFSVTLPEIALGGRTSLARSWAMSAGNGSRLVLVVIIIPVLMMAPFFALYLLENSALNYVAAFGGYITSLISLVMLSLSYRFLLEFYEPESVAGDAVLTDTAPLVQPDDTDDKKSGFDA